ncbi:NAD(P)-binding domain-containing protein [Streptomyces viridosporus]|uniref:NAD(P)-binding domain-containing protein n=1 Tax=Streptomyces viridosporus TaxID=67581 RepID=UPI0036FF1770
MERIDVAVIGGGQSGLAIAHALLWRGLRPVVLEASGRAAGSWPRYYDSLTLFSPARYSSLPGMPFPGADRDRYPHRDEVVAYLTAYADRSDAEIRTGCRVSTVRRTGLDTAPLGRFPSRPPTDDDRYRAALAAGQPERRPLFTGADGTKLVWPDGQREEVDAIVLATGYRPDLPYLARLDGALDAEGDPRHRGGLATNVPGLAFVGLERQRSLSSNSLRGVGRDAERIAWRLAALLARR